MYMGILKVMLVNHHKIKISKINKTMILIIINLIQIIITIDLIIKIIIQIIQIIIISKIINRIINITFNIQIIEIKNLLIKRYKKIKIKISFAEKKDLK